MSASTGTVRIRDKCVPPLAGVVEAAAVEVEAVAGYLHAWPLLDVSTKYSNHRTSHQHELSFAYLVVICDFLLDFVHYGSYKLLRTRT